MAGFRKFSAKKSFKAKTTGKLKRSVKRKVNPLYGKKGMGYVKSPSKAVKNSIYHKTTIGTSDLVHTNSSKSKANKINTTLNTNTSNDSGSSGCAIITLVGIGSVLLALFIKFWYIVLIIIGVAIVITLLSKKKKQVHNDQPINLVENKLDKPLKTNSNDGKQTKLEVSSEQVSPVIHKLRRKLYDFVVFDIETTGLNKNNEEIIQLSGIKYRNDKVVDQFNSFINPHKKLEQDVIFLTGIKDDDLVNAPELGQVLAQFTDFIEDLPLIGHNIIKFDLPFLYAHGFSVADISVIDTVKLSTSKLPELENHKLPTLKKFYGINNSSHNALLDCQTNAIVYQKLRDDDLEQVEVDLSTIPQTLKGKRVCITGQFIGVSRNELIDEIVEHGGKYTKTVSGLTDYLLDGTQTSDQLTDGVHSSSELKAAEFQKQNGKIKIIDYDQFENIVNNQDLKQII